MAQESGFWPTNGTGDGLSGGYASEQWQALLAALFVTDQAATQGVLRGYFNELAVTGSASPVAVASGGGIVNGLWYRNTASINLSVPTPSVGTTGHRVVLQADYSPQTVRVVLLSSADGNGSFPALTQSGLRWEISLATLSITTGGAITVTDTRSFCQFASDPQDNAVTTAKLANTAVTTAKLANDSVDDTKAGARVPQFYRRYGGSATDWATSGAVTVHTPEAVREQAGVVVISLAASVVGSTNIQFPVAFSGTPILVGNAVHGANHFTVKFSAVAKASVGIQVRHADGTTITTDVDVFWRAVGPE